MIFPNCCPNCSSQILNNKCTNCSLSCPFCNSLTTQHHSDEYQLYFNCKNHPNQLIFFSTKSFSPWKLQININNLHIIIYDSLYLSKYKKCSSYIFSSPNHKKLLNLPINIQNCHSFVNHPNLYSKLNTLITFK